MGLGHSLAHRKYTSKEFIVNILMIIKPQLMPVFYTDQGLLILKYLNEETLFLFYYCRISQQ